MLLLATIGGKYIKMAKRTTFDYLEGSLQYPYIFEDRTDKYDHYSVAVVLAGDQIKKAKKLGLKVNARDDRYDGLPYVQLKSNFKPDLFDENDEEYTGTKMIANGSTGIVKTTQRPYDNQYGQGVSTFLTAVKLLDVIPYEPDGESGKPSEF